MPHAIIAADIVKRGHTAAFYLHQSAHDFSAIKPMGWLALIAFVALVAMAVHTVSKRARRS